LQRLQIIKRNEYDGCLKHKLEWVPVKPFAPAQCSPM
jgi:hypothetical protein